MAEQRECLVTECKPHVLKLLCILAMPCNDRSNASFVTQNEKRKKLYLRSNDSIRNALTDSIFVGRRNAPFRL